MPELTQEKKEALRQLTKPWVLSNNPFSKRSTFSLCSAGNNFDYKVNRYDIYQRVDYNYTLVFQFLAEQGLLEITDLQSKMNKEGKTTIGKLPIYDYFELMFGGLGYPGQRSHAVEGSGIKEGEFLKGRVTKSSMPHARNWPAEKTYFKNVTYKNSDIAETQRAIDLLIRTLFNDHSKPPVAIRHGDNKCLLKSGDSTGDLDSYEHDENIQRLIALKDAGVIDKDTFLSISEKGMSSLLDIVRNKGTTKVQEDGGIVRDNVSIISYLIANEVIAVEDVKKQIFDGSYNLENMRDLYNKKILDKERVEGAGEPALNLSLPDRDPSSSAERVKSSALEEDKSPSFA